MPGRMGGSRLMGSPMASVMVVEDVKIVEREGREEDYD